MVYVRRSSEAFLRTLVHRLIAASWEVPRAMVMMVPSITTLSTAKVVSNLPRAGAGAVDLSRCLAAGPCAPCGCR